MPEDLKHSIGTGGRSRPLGAESAVDRDSKARGALRLLRGESLDALARELGVEIYRLEEWKNKALVGIDASLRERDGDPLEKELQSARGKIGELMMDNELLRDKMRKLGPLAKGRLRT